MIAEVRQHRAKLLKRSLYAAAGAAIAVGSILLLAILIVAGMWAAKSAGLTADDAVGIIAFFVLATGGGMLGWMHAKNREANP